VLRSLANEAAASRTGHDSATSPGLGAARLLGGALSCAAEEVRALAKWRLLRGGPGPTDPVTDVTRAEVGEG